MKPRLIMLAALLATIGACRDSHPSATIEMLAAGSKPEVTVEHKGESTIFHFKLPEAAAGSPGMPGTNGEGSAIIVGVHHYDADHRAVLYTFSRPDPGNQTVLPVTYTCSGGSLPSGAHPIWTGTSGPTTTLLIRFTYDTVGNLTGNSSAGLDDFKWYLTPVPNTPVATNKRNINIVANGKFCIYKFGPPIVPS